MGQTWAAEVRVNNCPAGSTWPSMPPQEQPERCIARVIDLRHTKCRCFVAAIRVDRSGHL